MDRIGVYMCNDKEVNREVKVFMRNAEENIEIKKRNLIGLDDYA
jgi:hypothetical protein